MRSAFVRDFYAAENSSFLPTFQDNQSVPSSRDKNPFFYFWPLKMGPIGCPETSARNFHYLQRNDPEWCSCNLLRGGSLKSSKDFFAYCFCHWQNRRYRVCVRFCSRGVLPLLLSLVMWFTDWAPSSVREVRLVLSLTATTRTVFHITTCTNS